MAMDRGNDPLAKIMTGRHRKKVLDYAARCDTTGGGCADLGGGRHGHCLV
jgi:hypothetical protein